MRDSSFWNVTVPRAMSIYSTTIFVMLWVGFVVVLVVNREWLDLIWGWVQVLPLIPRIMIWVVFLPIMVSLWIWESSWPVLVRLVGFVGMAVWTLLAVSSLIRAFR